MGIPLDIFSLYMLWGEGAGCPHYLLLRVGRPSFSNADEREYARAAGAADEKGGALIEAYKAEVLAAECGADHAVNLLAELQSRPVGDVLSEGRGGFCLDVWVAETRFGRPWAVLGTAASEEEFWREVESDEDLRGLSPRAPARKVRAFFLADGGGEAEE